MFGKNIDLFISFDNCYFYDLFCSVYRSAIPHRLNVGL